MREGLVIISNKEFWFGSENYDGVFFSRIRRIVRLYKGLKNK